jgi:hypothetical protein
MYAFSVESVNVNAEFLVRAVSLPTQTLEGKNFFLCNKTSHPLKRVLLVGTPYGESAQQYSTALERTDVIESIKAKRDVEWFRRMPAAQSGQRRYTSRESMPIVLGLPESVCISTPEVCGLASVPMLVALTKPSTGVLVELTTANLEWLRKAVVAQLDEGSCPKRKNKANALDDAERVSTDVANVFWSYKKGLYRAIYCPPGAKKRRKQCFTADKDEAKVFARTGARPPRQQNDDDAINGDAASDSDPEKWADVGEGLAVEDDA